MITTRALTALVMTEKVRHWSNQCALYTALSITYRDGGWRRNAILAQQNARRSFSQVQHYRQLAIEAWNDQQG